ncbi:MAG: hypothetical protein ACKPKO_65895, partial [Candidatus Fonsibacter sp.]
QCAKDGQEQTVHAPDDECEATWLHLRDIQDDNGDVLDLQALTVQSTSHDTTEDPLEMYYTSDMSNWPIEETTETGWSMSISPDQENISVSAFIQSQPPLRQS